MNQMKRIQNGLIVIFSVIAVAFYFSQPKRPVPVITPPLASNLVLYVVDEEYDILLKPISVACMDTKDCILKSYQKMSEKPYGVLPENAMIQDLLLEEGKLKIYFDPSFLSMKLQKQKEALLWYFLQFEDVKQVQIYVDDIPWKWNLYSDSKRVFSTDFRLFTGDLYASMPMIFFSYKTIDQKEYETVETIRIPQTEDVEQMARWLLQVQAKPLAQIKNVTVDQNKVTVSFKGQVEQTEMKHWLIPFAHSLLVLPQVDEVACYHEEILIIQLQNK
ncbi:MAG: hypothetical protein PUF50_05015 [Erysipelotrichaceae bacterium]|nr:hypothetical protein [Erysipelotrichaceae bacterium]